LEVRQATFVLDFQLIEVAERLLIVRVSLDRGFIIFFNSAIMAAFFCVSACNHFSRSSRF
jgi:hypothetical protein